MCKCAKRDFKSMLKICRRPKFGKSSKSESKQKSNLNAKIPWKIEMKLKIKSDEVTGAV